jgi:hypothetical protein
MVDLPCHTALVFPKTWAAWQETAAAFKAPLLQAPEQPPLYPKEFPRCGTANEFWDWLCPGKKRPRRDDARDNEFISLTRKVCTLLYTGALSFSLPAPISKSVLSLASWKALKLAVQSNETGQTTVTITEESMFFPLAQQWQAYLPALDKFSAAEIHAYAPSAAYEAHRTVPTIDCADYRGLPKNLFKRKAAQKQPPAFNSAKYAAIEYSSSALEPGEIRRIGAFIVHRPMPSQEPLDVNKLLTDLANNTSDE